MLNKILSLLPQSEKNLDTEDYKPAIRSFYCLTTISFTAICEAFVAKIKSEQGWDVLSWSDTESMLVQYRPEQKLKRKLGVENTFVLTAAQEREKIRYSISQVEGKGAERLDSPDDLPSLQKSGWFAEAHADTLHQMLGKLIWEEVQARLPVFSSDNQEAHTGDTLVLLGGRYVGYEWSVSEQLFWHTQRQYGEQLLTALPIGKLKSWPQEAPTPIAEADWWYVLSSQRSGWVGRQEDGTMQFIPHPYAELIPHKEVGRDTIRAGRFVWEATGGSERYFHELPAAVAILDAPLRRIRMMAQLNWHHKAQHEASNQYAQHLLAYLVGRNGHPKDRLALFYTQFAQRDRKNALALQSDRTDQLQRGVGILPELLFLPEANAQFKAWATGWYVSEADQLAIFHLLLRAGYDAELPYRNLLESHRNLREHFLKNEKEVVKKVWVETAFCQHLIWAGERAEGIEMLEETREALPDEQLADLLPPNDLDMTDKLSGQVLRIRVLDLLIEAKGEKKARNLLAEAARLQPLVPERVERWLPHAEKDVKDRAEALERVLKPQGLHPASHDEEDPEVHFRELSEKLLMSELRHPASQEKSIKTTLQKWLAEAPKPDLQSLRAFAQEPDPQEHAAIYAKITDIRQALGLPAVACYLTHGEQSVGVQAYTDETPFLVIGIAHCQPESPFFLRPKEWWFTLAHELAYLRFGHIRLTTDSVWEGAKEKGFFALDTMLSLLPGISSLGSAMKIMPSLNRFTALAQQAQRLQQLADSGQQLVQLANTAASLVSHETEKTANDDWQEQQLLATSRMMQLSADRVGLLIANDLPAAIRAIFLNSPAYQPELELVRKYGLTNLLRKQNEAGELRFQELAIRLAALFSFYLSEEFALLRETLEGER